MVRYARPIRAVTGWGGYQLVPHSANVPDVPGVLHKQVHFCTHQLYQHTVHRFTNWRHPVELLTTYFPSHDTFATDRHGTGTGTAQQIRFAPGTAQKMRLTAFTRFSNSGICHFSVNFFVFRLCLKTKSVLKSLCNLPVRFMISKEKQQKRKKKKRKT